MDPNITLDPPPDDQQPKQDFYLPTTPSPTKTPIRMPPQFLFRTSPIRSPVKSPRYVGLGLSPGKMFALSVPPPRYISSFDASPVASPVRSPLAESGSFEEVSLSPAYNSASPVPRAEEPIVSNETNNPASPTQHPSTSNHPPPSPPSMTISPASFYNRNGNPKGKFLPSPSNPPTTKIRLTTSSSNSPKNSPILGATSPPKLRLKIVNPSFNTNNIQTSSATNSSDIENDEMARTRSTKRKFEATEVEGQTKSKTLEPLIKKRMGVQPTKTRLPSTKRDFVKIEEDHAQHNTLESLIKKKAFVHAEPAILPKKHGKTWAQFEKEAIKASLEKGPIVPHCCKPHPVKYNHGHIQVENESGDEDEVETQYEDRPRGRAPKVPKKDTPFHLQEFFAPVASLEDHFRAAHFLPGWTNVAFAKRSHVEKAATNAVANAFSGIHGNDNAYIHGDMKVDINDFLTKSSKETLHMMAGPDAQLKREEVRKWSAEDKKGLEKLLELVKEKLRLAEEKEVKVKGEKKAVKD